MQKLLRVLSLIATLLATVPTVHAQIAPGELVAPKMEISGADLNFTIQPSLSWRNYQLQYSDTMAGGTWQDLGVVRNGDGTNLVISTPYVAGVQRRFYRVALAVAPAAPAGFSLISAGSFEMGQTGTDEPVHSVNVSGCYMGKYEVTMEEWDAVRAWGLTHGYTDLAVGNGSYATKGANHPVHSITWYDMVKWCNARSQKENLVPSYYTDAAQTVIYKTGSVNIDNTMVKWSANGYRLPSEAEWEKAARGGLSSQNFPWGNTITHSEANYYSSTSYAYDLSPTRGYHPVWHTGSTPYTSPVGSFAPNGYGLYDMAGNAWEWCWDWYGGYTAGSQTDPRGPASGSIRVYRGGGWGGIANGCRVASRFGGYPFSGTDGIGFRPARSSVP